MTRKISLTLAAGLLAATAFAAPAFAIDLGGTVGGILGGNPGAAVGSPGVGGGSAGGVRETSSRGLGTMGQGMITEGSSGRLNPRSAPSTPAVSPDQLSQVVATTGNGDPVADIIAGAGLPPVEAVPFTAGFLASAALGNLGSPDPVGATSGFAIYQVQERVVKKLQAPPSVPLTAARN